VLVALALVFVAIGYWEYATRSLLLNPKVIASNQLEEAFRVNSLFFDPNIYGRFLAVVMLALAAVLLWIRRPRIAWLSAAAVALLWGGLVLTLSQSSFAALLLGLGVLALLRFPPPWTLGGAAVLAVAAVAVVALWPSTFGLEGTRSLDDATSGRAELVRGGIDLAVAEPLLGHGSGAFAREYRRREESGSRQAVSASHTIPVTVAAEQGIVGLAVYVALLFTALQRLLRRAGQVAARAAVGAAFAAVVLHTWSYAAFLEDPLTWSLLGAGTALAAAFPARRPRRAAAAPPVAA
jgi:O-antigen ligase